MVSVRNIQAELLKGKCLKLCCDSGGKQHYMLLKYSNKYYCVSVRGKLKFDRKYMQEKTFIYHLEQWLEIHNYSRIFIIDDGGIKNV